MDDEVNSEAVLRESLRGELRLSKSPITRWFFIAAGTLSLVVGVIGIFLPVMPTTPFLLLTAFCYARGSERFYLWLLTNRYFGEYIRAWRNNEGIPRAVKIYVIVVLWYVLGFTTFFVIPLWTVRILFLLAGVGVTIYIVQLPTRQS